MLFDVVLNIHVFMLRRKREMMQKKVIHSSTPCCMLWGTNTLPTHTHTHTDANELLHSTVAQAAILSRDT